MGELQIYGKYIRAPITEILSQVQLEIETHKLKVIKNKGDEVMVCCPYHKNGMETHPSCSVCATTNKDIPYGYAHCFTCGYNAPLYTFIGDCFDKDSEFGKEWLIDRFGNIFVEKTLELPMIDISSPKRNFLNDSILTQYNYYHPYMWKRNISKEVVDKYHIGYNQEKHCITFPVWDEHNNLVMITERDVFSKKFYIPENVDKPVYLLNFIRNDNIDEVFVTESQINALTLESYGYRAIALFGTGSKHQYDILNKSGIRTYHLALDGDYAGKKGTIRFINSIKSDVFVDVVNIPYSKDVNDLTKSEFDSLEVTNAYDWVLKNK